MGFYTGFIGVVQGLCFNRGSIGVVRGYLRLPPIMEKQMEKKQRNKMVTGMTLIRIRVLLGSILGSPYLWKRPLSLVGRLLRF